MLASVVGALMSLSVCYRWGIVGAFAIFLAGALAASAFENKGTAGFFAGVLGALVFYLLSRS
jgi:hypothetical protein